MKWCIILMSMFAVTCSRPQDNVHQNEETTVELLTFPNGLRFPKWLPHPDHQSQFFGKLHHPFIFNPKSHFTLYNNLHPTQSEISSSTQYYHFPRYHKNPETLTVQGLNSEPTRSVSSKITTQTPAAMNLKLKVESTTTPKPVTASTREEIKVSDILKHNNQIRLQAINLKDPSSLAPYRAHPLFHYVKNKNTIQKDKIISFRNEDQAENDITTLILKPVARAVAGVEGKAVSTPVSKAILRPGTNVDILFEPEAVAIAGAGGIAHAESNLEISYEEII